MQYPQGLDPYSARQHLLHNTYSPLISLQSSYNSESKLKSILDEYNNHDDDLSILMLFKLYGNNAKYSIPNQSFKITNTQLITKNYPSFPIRFEPLLPDLLSIRDASNNFDNNKLNQLFSITSLEILLKHISTSDPSLTKGLYLKFFNKIITSNNIVPFETFNHPISQIFVINFPNDSIDDLRKLIVEFRNLIFPPYFQIDDLLIHIFILYDSSQISDSDIVQFQNLIKKNLSVNSTSFPINNDNNQLIQIPKNEYSTIEQDLQIISLNHSSSKKISSSLNIPISIDTVLRNKIHEYINKYLIPHMQKKIRIWDDQILAPKKSFTGRIFSVSKKFFNNNNNSNPSIESSPENSSFNYSGNYYHKSSTEQTIRKLADWCLILKDFKYAYSTYDFIKKDYTNDKAWVYVASIQEMCIVSLLLAQTQQIQSSSSINSPDKNTLRKIRHDIIEPYIDNLSYTFKSRLNVKTYSLKSLLITNELLLCMCVTYNISGWWIDLLEKFFCKCINEFDTHLVSNNQSLQVIRAILYERLGYTFGKCIYLSSDDRRYIDINPSMFDKSFNSDPVPEGHYSNPNKLHPDKNNAIKGLTRLRKSSIWYLLSIKEWLVLKNFNQILYLLQCIGLTYNIKHDSNDWYDKSDVLLGFVKKSLKDYEHENQID